ncbi:DUF6783 domain-containing protein [Robinsoniella sp.]
MQTAKWGVQMVGMIFQTRSNRRPCLCTSEERIET